MTAGSLGSLRIVADDLSGAADCAAAFAQVAGPVPVYLGAVQAQAPCVAIDTDSRAMERAAATAATARAFEEAASGGVAHRLVYKKIDSTLRGHIAAELEAALRVVPRFAGAVVAPAFPEQGRTLSHGRLRIQGRPAETFGHSGDLMGMLEATGLRPALVSQPLEDPVRLLQLIEQALRGGARAVVVDAASQGDLAHLAAALCAPGAARLLVAGSAGLARALAAQVEPRPGTSAREGDCPVRPGPVLAVVGSFSRASAAQVQEVAASGDAQVIRLDAGQWLDGQHSRERRVTLEAARDSLRLGRNLLFAIGGEVAQPASRSLVQAMARTTAPLLRHAVACVLTGGDTARAMFTELAVDRLEVSGEFEPGISLARAASDAGPLFVLKAGGFGDALALRRIIRHFGQRREAVSRQVAPS